MNHQAIIPVEQALVPFYEDEILSARLPDDFVAASMNSLCAMLKVNTQAQVRRILRDEVLAKYLLLVRVETPGGPQTTEMLSAKAIPMWLTGLQPNMVAPEKRPLIRALKEEAVEVLYRYFFKIGAEQATRPAPSALPEMDGSPWQIAHQALDIAHEVLYAAEEREQALMGKLATLEDELAALKKRQAGQTGWQQRPATHPLSPEHQIQLTALARFQRGQTGEPIQAMNAELAKLFGVEDVSDIPDDNWDAIQQWFWQRRQRTR
jgi:hypothetical protein